MSPSPSTNSSKTSSSSHHLPPSLSFGDRVICGGIAGISENLLFYPLDVVKTRAQLDAKPMRSLGAAAGSNLSSVVKTPGTFRSLVQLFREGTAYRGMGPPMLIETPKRAIKFAVNEQLQNSPSIRRLSDNPQTVAAICGMGAGAAEAFAIVPFELIKVRLQDKTTLGKYVGPLDVLKDVFRNEGPQALFKGLESTLWKHVSWNGGYFAVIFSVKSRLPSPMDEKGQLVNNFLAGSLAGTFGVVLNTPFDVAKSRIQNQAHGVTKYSWTIPSLATIAREEGSRALYKGFVAKVARMAPGGGVLLVVFDYVSRSLLRHKQSS